MSDQIDASNVVERLLKEAGVTDKLPGADDPELAALDGRIAGQCEVIAKITKRAGVEEQGGTRIVVRGWSFRISGTVWPLIVCTVKVVIAAHDPTGLSWKDALEEAVEAIGDLASVIHRLDPAQQLVCTAIAGKQAEHKLAKIKPDGATVQDMRDYYTTNKLQAPVTLDGVIKALVDKKVLARSDDPVRGAFYHITF
jgi:hypothetical protein